MLESRSPGLATWLLVGTVLLIIVTAFTAAFVPLVKCPGGASCQAAVDQRV